MKFADDDSDPPSFTVTEVVGWQIQSFGPFVGYEKLENFLAERRKAVT